MVILKERRGLYYLSLRTNPLPRVLKFERFQKYIQECPQAKVALDYGSGDRPYEKLLLQRHSQYVAADWAVTNAKYARRPDIELTGGPIQAADNSFDCALFTEVLEHIYEPKVVLADLYRVLKPGGRLIGSVPFATGEHDTPHDYYRYTSFSLKRMFADVGFSVLSLDYIGGMFSVTLHTATRMSSLVSKFLRKAKLSPLAWLWDTLLMVPGYAYLFLRKTGLNPDRIEFLRGYPLGYTFLLEKPVSASKV